MDRSILLEDDTSKLCRICFDDSDQEDLISPCLCSGGSAYVHRKCLDNWRSLNKDDRAFQFCDVCQFKYVIEPLIDNPSADRKRFLIFSLLVIRDITLIILLVQLIILSMTFLLQFADKKNQFIKDLYPSSMGSFGIYYLTSFILFLAFLGLFGLIGYCYGLTKNNDHTYNNDNIHHGNCCMCYCPNTCCAENHGDDQCGKFTLVVLIIIVVIFAVIGIFVGIILTWMIIRNILNRHTNKLWLKQETKKYIVKDFQGERDQLQNILNQRSNTQSLTDHEMDNETTIMLPSAPIQAMSNKDKYII